MNNAVAVAGLSKRFGDTVAVDAVDLEIAQGELFSLLGPNGAGKTTLMSMLAGLLRPDAGRATIAGRPAGSAAARAVLGVVPQDVALYPDLSARENLAFWGSMYGLRGAPLRRRCDELLGVIDLEDRQRDRVGTFSGGMKRRLNIAAALLHEPAVLMLDEPTVGIDPQSRRAILDYVAALNRAGTTVLYTTHYMEEAQELSHRIGILDHGRVIALGTHAELVRIVGERDVIDLELSTDAVAADLGDAFVDVPGVGADGANAEDGHLRLLAEDSETALPRLFQRAATRGVSIRSVTVTEPNLESVFLQLTGRALRD
ncbi:MAG TPA: ATP-binding cassette domain-containing protein [Trueperaceae bacterium]|nr:ATP-binding cassette domain-containing protein [Trueperaceae bacterium]